MARSFESRAITRPALLPTRYRDPKDATASRHRRCSIEAAAGAASASRSTTTTDAPRVTSARPVAKPMPRAPPVTRRPSRPGRTSPSTDPIARRPRPATLEGVPGWCGTRPGVLDERSIVEKFRYLPVRCADGRDSRLPLEPLGVRIGVRSS